MESFCRSSFGFILVLAGDQRLMGSPEQQPAAGGRGLGHVCSSAVRCWSCSSVTSQAWAVPEGALPPEEHAVGWHRPCIFAV